MRFVFFPHSLASDWNHGNAHFVRGVIRDLIRRGHDVRCYEVRDNWSRWCLRRDHGPAAETAYQTAYPELSSTLYHLDTLDLDDALDGADVVIVHEFNQHELVRRIGEHRQRHDYLLLFHDTHHRVVSDPEAMRKYDLSHYDGVLAFGEVLQQAYLQRGWTQRAWTWHEAADVTLFHPSENPVEPTHDLIWIGNWGDGERTAELHEYLLNPVRRLRLKARVYGVRYPSHAVEALRSAGIEYAGALPNHRVPEVFARARLTVHVPRRPYVEQLPGIPTIRPFEALACGIPLISSPWTDAERLFRVGDDFLMVDSGDAMAAAMKRVLNEPDLRTAVTSSGLETIRAGHTCAHRVDELLRVVAEME